MSEQEIKKVRRLITGILIGLTAVVLAYFGYSIFSKNTNMTAFQVIMGVWLVCYVLLLDVLEPYLLKEFENLTPERKTGYMKYLGTDIIGIGGLVLFVFMLGNPDGNSTVGLVGAIVYAFSMRPRQKFRKEFLGIVDEVVQEEEEDHSPLPTAADAAARNARLTDNEAEDTEVPEETQKDEAEEAESETVGQASDQEGQEERE
ncbi:hypothetical protein [Diplocloster agilis]|uniref:Uncharacterized protein n=1 Tax=Diplocloster agilis TaxID=2850323 RepID=A0A949NGE4_9FIRM|nr:MULTISPECIES: hypothetical protein [Lachnospiraceae]MBU9739561.1 hypothetical protein [Diplocloster agilis]MCU6735415.1 hypothetical protein [Suonthocola fibrivorans]SCJ73340.1 Uncharacterised protein [uncultured Clostridium sp.]